MNNNIMDDNAVKKPQRQFFWKYGALVFLIILSIMIASCGGGGAQPPDKVTFTQVPATTTFAFNHDQTPIPTAPPYYCGAWVTNSTPAFYPNSLIAVNVKFVKNNNGIPSGIAGASVTVTLTWADYHQEVQTTTTSTDGLGIVYFAIPNRETILNKASIADVVFSSSEHTCIVENDRAAFFTVIKPSPTPVPTKPIKPTPTKKKRDR